MKLAIVGSGIGGCSAAYYAKQLITKEIDITIYEANNRIGGRLLSRKVDSIMVELGGTFFHSVNKNMQSLVKKLALETEEFQLSSMGIWDGGPNFVFKSSRYSFLTNLRLLIRYRLSALRLINLSKTIKKNLLKLYKENHFEKAYTTEIELFSSYIHNLMSKTIKEYLIDSGISPNLVYELIDPAIRYIYCQNADIGGFAGIGAIIASDGSPLFKIRQGNIVLAEKLIESAAAEVRLNQKIVKITKEQDNRYKLFDQNLNYDDYDAVILAAPLEQLNIIFENIMLPKIKFREFRKVYIKLIVGMVNPSFFNLRKITDVPELVITTEQFRGPFNSLETLGLTSEKHYVYNLFSINQISNNLLDQMFSERILEEDYTWEYAYPIAKLKVESQPIILDKNIFYINMVESTASTMETSTLGAKNTILLLKQSLNKMPF